MDQIPQREDEVKTQGERPQAKERGRGQILPQASAETNPAGALVWDLRPPDCETVHACGLCHPVCVVCVAAPAANTGSHLPRCPSSQSWAL